MNVHVITFFVRQAAADETDPKNFYGSSESEKDGDDDEDDGSEPKKKPYVMDMDHRLLLRSAKPLLNSRNAAVRCLDVACISF